MRTPDEAKEEVARIGLQEGDPGYATAVGAAMRGWPAWRIAQHLQCSPELIYKLGGPEPGRR